MSNLVLKMKKIRNLTIMMSKMRNLAIMMIKHVTSQISQPI